MDDFKKKFVLWWYVLYVPVVLAIIILSIVCLDLCGGI